MTQNSSVYEQFFQCLFLQFLLQKSKIILEKKVMTDFSHCLRKQLTVESTYITQVLAENFYQNRFPQKGITLGIYSKAPINLYNQLVFCKSIFNAWFFYVKLWAKLIFYTKPRYNIYTFIYMHICIYISYVYLYFYLYYI